MLFLQNGVDPEPFDGFDRDDKRRLQVMVMFMFLLSAPNMASLMGNVKIGYTNSITSRYKDLQHCNGNRLKVMGYWRGEKTKMKRFEGIAHHVAMDNHRHGEWFHFKNTRQIEQLVESISKHERV